MNNRILLLYTCGAFQGTAARTRKLGMTREGTWNEAWPAPGVVLRGVRGRGRPGAGRSRSRCSGSPHMPILMLWMIWKMADPHTTKMNSASSHGPTDAFSSGAVLEVLATFPRWVMFLLCFSLAMRMRCLATMVRPGRAGPAPLRCAAPAAAPLPASAPRGAARRKRGPTT